MDTDNRILLIAQYVSRSLCILIVYAIGNMLQCLVFAQKLLIQECTCAYGASPVSGGGRDR